MSRGNPRAATPALAVVVSVGVWHQLYEYNHDSTTDNFGYVAAAQLGIDPRRLYKTLVVVTPDGLLVNAVIAVTDLLHLKRLAKVLDVKSVEMADPLVVQRKTGYVLDGISPLGQQTPLPTVMDTSVREHDTVWISGGRRGLSLELRVTDLSGLSQATVAQIRR